MNNLPLPLKSRILEKFATQKQNTRYTWQVSGSKPIGCNVFHFTKQVGKKWICMYCGKEVIKPKT